MKADTLRDVGAIRSLVDLDASATERERIYDALASMGAIVNGHFSLQSGEHSEHFLRFRALARSAASVALIADALLNRVKAPDKIDAVVCPESAGFALGEELATRFGAQLVSTKVDLRRRPSSAVRSGHMPRGGHVLVVNDLATTGTSLLPLLDVARLHACTVAHVFLFATFDAARVRDVLENHDTQLTSIAALRWPRFASDACPACKRGEELLPALELN
jgi:orotate phosphoribosyltransferase